MVQNVIIWGFTIFGNELPKTTYLPAVSEMEVAVLSEKQGNKESRSKKTETDNENIGKAKK